MGARTTRSGDPTGQGEADALKKLSPRPGLSDVQPAGVFGAPPVPLAGPRGEAKPARSRGARPRPQAIGQPDLIDHLGDRDALFALLSRVMPWAQASTAAATLLERYGTLTEALSAPEEELAAIGSLGAGAAGVLKVAHAAALRLVAAPLRQGPVLRRWRELEDYLMAAMAREPVEHLRVLFLDARNRLIGDEVMATGGPRGVNPDYCALARRAVQLHATAVILAHNHPSGEPLASPEDIEATRAMQEVLSAVGVAMHDHLIVARGGILSLRSLGVIGR